MNNHYLIGLRFDRWTVMGIGKKRNYLLCRCDCGTIKEVYKNNLVHHKSRSCGCLFLEINSKIHTVHGKFGTPLYNVWNHMVNRCENHHDKRYMSYGGRGIKVCARWHIAKKFIQDMQEGYSPSLQLDRINNDGDYEPNNCRWVTRTRNCRNRRTTVFVSMNGSKKTLPDWADIFHVKQESLRHFLQKHGYDNDITVFNGALCNIGKQKGIVNCPFCVTTKGLVIKKEGDI